MATIKHEVWIDAPIATVYELLATPAGMSSWWDTQTQVQTPDGEAWEHTPGPGHGTVRMLIVRNVPNELFEWRCVSTHDPGVPASAWTGTTMRFELGDRGSSAVATEHWAAGFPVQTVLRFQHEGWDGTSRYLPFCTTAWAAVLQQLADKASARKL